VFNLFSTVKCYCTWLLNRVRQAGGGVGGVTPKKNYFGKNRKGETKIKFNPLPTIFRKF